MKERSRASREFAQRKLRYEEGFRAGLLRAAEIARTSKFGEHESGATHVPWEDAVARSETLCRLIATAIESEAGREG